MSKADRIMEGPEFPAWATDGVESLCMSMVTLATIKTHAEEIQAKAETGPLSMLIDGMDNSCRIQMALLGEIAKAHDCDPMKTWSHWLKVVQDNILGNIKK